jgi:hypothetical protein
MSDMTLHIHVRWWVRPLIAALCWTLTKTMRLWAWAVDRETFAERLGQSLSGWVVRYGVRFGSAIHRKRGGSWAR